MSEATTKSKICAVLVLIGLMTIIPAGIVEAKTSSYTGWQREYYTDGRPRIALRYKKGILIQKRAYYRNGRLLNDFIYRDEKVYKIRHFYDNGKLKGIWTRKNGISKLYYRNGKLKTTVKSNPDDKDNKFLSSYIFFGD